MISFIIPCYNAASTISRCLDSILTAEKVDIVKEIICINDGSSDDTLSILEEYAEENDIIKIIDKPNEGVYVARNLGLQLVSADYIWLVDSDDFISENSFLILEPKLGESDIINFGYQQEGSNGEYEKYLSKRENIGLMSGYEYLDRNDGRLYLWNNVYRRSFLKENNLRFLARSVSLEDSLFNTLAFAKADTVYSLSEVLYSYCINGNSISRTKMLEHLLKQAESSVNVHTEILDFRNSLGKNSMEYGVIHKRLMHTVLGFFYSLLVERYPISEVRRVLVKYENIGLLPVDRSDNDIKISVFQLLVNMKWPYLLLCRLNKLLSCLYI